MPHFIPALLHRRLYRLADRLRKIWWRIAKPQLQAATIIATDADGCLLLIRLSYGTNGWTLPIGGINKGEDPAAAARRELREETGCDAQSLEFLGVEEGIMYGTPNRVYIYAAQISGTPIVNMREVISAGFFPLHSLPEPLSSGTKKRLALWLNLELD